MEHAKLTVLRFANSDVIATSGILPTVTVSNFGNKENLDNTIQISGKNPFVFSAQTSTVDLFNYFKDNGFAEAFNEVELDASSDVKFLYDSANNKEFYLYIDEDNLLAVDHSDFDGVYTWVTIPKEGYTVGKFVKSN